jgi:hypothetical protein
MIIPRETLEKWLRLLDPQTGEFLEGQSAATAFVELKTELQWLLHNPAPAPFAWAYVTDEFSTASSAHRIPAEAMFGAPLEFALFADTEGTKHA